MSGDLSEAVVDNIEREGVNKVKMTKSGSSFGTTESSLWKLPAEQQQQQQQQSQGPSFPVLNKPDPRISSRIHESLSQNVFQTVDRSPKQGGGSKLQSCFPEARLSSGFSNPKITSPPFALQSPSRSAEPYLAEGKEDS